MTAAARLAAEARLYDYDVLAKYAQGEFFSS